MRLVSLIFILLLSASCGKDGGGTSSSSRDSGACNLNGRSVACQQIAGADGNGIDLLDTMVADVPVKIDGSEIKFLADKASMTKGRRISCSTSVKNGEIYRAVVNGDRLNVMTSNGSYEMERLTNGSGLVGTWTWKGYVDQGTHMIRTMTILGNNRVILSSNCEL